MGGIVRGSILLLICLMTSGCPVGYMMSDRHAYIFQGKIYSSLDQKVISSVKVNASCRETKLDPPLQIMSDAKGSFSLHGYYAGALDDCELSFEHPLFKRKTVRLKPARELTADTGLSRVWTLNVELEPN